MKHLFFALAGLFGAGFVHAETAVILRATELQAQSQTDAAMVARLPENTRVEVLQRRGAWSEIKTAAGQTGWVRMLTLKIEADGNVAAAAPARTTANPLGSLTSLLTAGRTSNTATVTTGVRGLSEEDLQNAQANPAELDKAQKFSADKKDAQAFAQRTRLTPAKVDYLPDAAPARNNATRSDGG